MKNIFTQLILIVEEYVGPASERFVKRQIEFHVSKEPEDLTNEDLGKLSNSIARAIGVLAKDKNIVDDISKRILAIK